MRRAIDCNREIDRGLGKVWSPLGRATSLARGLPPVYLPFLLAVLY
jgi:hypothetical protein